MRRRSALEEPFRTAPLVVGIAAWELLAVLRHLLPHLLDAQMSPRPSSANPFEEGRLIASFIRVCSRTVGLSVVVPRHFKFSVGHGGQPL